MTHTEPTHWLIDGSQDADWRFALAHGAGAPMDSDFMAFFAEQLAEEGFSVVRFEFPYMHRRRSEGKQRPPDRGPVLEQTWCEVIEVLGPQRLIIGGKSMGGRIASLVADTTQVAGLVCLGYPFHPVGKPEKVRVEHLRALATPTLVLQGERDPFGKPEEVAHYALASSITVQWVPDGDHSFKPRKRSGRTVEQNWREAATQMVAFGKRVASDLRRRK